MGEVRTLVTHGRLAMREAFLAAARNNSHGLQVLTFEQMVARLAGGFACPVDNDALLSTVREALISTDLGALDEIKALPGMAHAAAETLRKAWRAGINLQARAAEHPRVASLASLEGAVLEHLPSRMLPPGALVSAAMDRIQFAGKIFGPIEIRGLTELSPVWRPLLKRLPKALRASFGDAVNDHLQQKTPMRKKL